MFSEEKSQQIGKDSASTLLSASALVEADSSDRW